MKLTFLGTRGEIEARTRRHRMHSSLMISHGGADVMIDCGRFVLGEELRRFSNTQLELALDTTDIHFARVDAEQKMRIVAALKCKEHIVAGHRRWRKRLGRRCAKPLWASRWAAPAPTWHANQST